MYDLGAILYDLGITEIHRKNRTPRPRFGFGSVRVPSPKPEQEETEFRVATDS